MQKVKNFFSWLLLSSSNPQKAAATLDGFLVMLVPYLTIVFHLLNINVGNTDLNAAINSGVLMFQAFLVLVGLTWTFLGLARKIVLTVAGQNKVLIALATRPKPAVVVPATVVAPVAAAPVTQSQV